MTDRTCEIDGCERPHLARGMCSSHYGSWHKRTFGRKRESFTLTCIVCSETWETRRKEAKFCSDICKGQWYSDTMRKHCKLPGHHPVMVRVKALREEERARRAELKKAEKFAWRTARECPGCACWFTPLHTPNSITCSKRCARRVHRWRRNAAERGAMGSFTWSEFMRIAQRFDYCCAYCGEKPTRLDADHVVPLSRGGSNSTTNLLPTCPPCNTDKNANLLDEWAESRERRGLPPRRTNWAPEDRRYWHLTDAVLRVA